MQMHPWRSDYKTIKAAHKQWEGYETDTYALSERPHHNTTIRRSESIDDNRASVIDRIAARIRERHQHN